MSLKEIEFEFVEFIPSERAPGTLYVSTEFATVVHDCMCGCGHKVVTPLNPTGWKLIFDGETVSLDPSVGNWGFPCRSHYIIDRNRIVWADDMTMAQIEHGRERDRALRAWHFGEVPKSDKIPIEIQNVELATPQKKKGFWRRFFGI